MIQIAIDGPSGAGKSTIAKLLAKKMNMLYLDTGAMFRAITFYCLDNKIDIFNEESVKMCLNNIKIDFIDDKVHINSVDKSEEIRTPLIAKNVSQIAKQMAVRDYLLKSQRDIANSISVVMDGRDIGTHVLPNADYKFFLTASIEERASRRLKELVSKGIEVDYEELKKDIFQRDKMDSEREIAPLKQAQDALLVETTQMTIDDVVNFISSAINI